MPKARTTASSRLTMDDSIQAGYAILAEEGIKALKTGHAVFDYDTSRELAGALTLGMKVSQTAMV